MTTIDGAPAFGRLVRDAREERHLTQAALARAAGVGRQWLVGFELGDKQSAPLDMILRLLQALDLEVTLTPPRRARAAKPPVDLDAIISRMTRSRE